ncbi:PZRN3 ligase, partial [Polyodon spathula]|nr:PZRN3 ligase [Polyodon spathula]
MGFDLDRFAEAVDPDLKCKLCTKVLEEPLSTPCGHVFCAACLLPWAVQQRLCPLQCQTISAKELHQVLPLKNLIQKLDIRCEYHSRGCAKTVNLQELRDHVDMCDYSPAQCRNKGCNEVLNLKDMDSHMRESCDYRPVGICQKGCGLVLLHKDAIQGNHCCLRALRAQNGALQVKTSSLEQDTKKQAIKCSKREKSLLAQVSALQNEVQLTALRYQKKFNQYMIHINNITKYVASHCKALPDLFELLYMYQVTCPRVIHQVHGVVAYLSVNASHRWFPILVSDLTMRDKKVCACTPAPAGEDTPRQNKHQLRFTVRSLPMETVGAQGSCCEA